MTSGLPVGFDSGFADGLPVVRLRSNCCSYFDRLIFARINKRVNFFACAFWDLQSFVSEKMSH